MRVDNDNVARLADVDCLEDRCQIRGQSPHCYSRADEPYALKQRLHVGGHRIEAAHTVRLITAG